VRSRGASFAGACTALLLAALAAADAAQAQPAEGRGGIEARASFDLVRAYLAELRNPAGAAPAAGPREFRLERKSGEQVTTEVAPIARLAAMLRNCRKASFSASWGGSRPPQFAEGRQHWECLGEGAEDKSVLVTASSSDGKTVERVSALLGGPIYWPGPAPRMGQQLSGADAVAFEANKSLVFAFLDRLKAGEAGAAPGEIAIWVGEKRSPIPLARARELLASCDRLWAHHDRVPIDGATRTGVNLGWKCDKESSAWADLAGLVTVADGALDRFYISPHLDYHIPPSRGRQDRTR
jgi:hypothetical protein